MQPQQPSRLTLPRAARIRSRKDFDRVFARRNRVSDGVLTVHMARSEHPLARLGIAASRRLGNAVVRNRAKRLVREAFRQYRGELPPGTDWVVIPVRADAALAEVDESLRRLCGRLLRREEEQQPERQGSADSAHAGGPRPEPASDQQGRTINEGAHGSEA